MEDNYYNSHVKEKVDSSCYFLHHSTSNNDHTNEEVGENFSLSLSSNLKSFECNSEVKIKFVDEVAKNIEKDIEVLEDQIQPYRLHDQDQYFQKLSMPENKERVLLHFSFEFEEEYIVFENQFEKQFESTQLKSYVVDQSMDELSKVVEFHEKHQIDHVFFDPIVDYMERF